MWSQGEVLKDYRVGIVLFTFGFIQTEHKSKVSKITKILWINSICQEVPVEMNKVSYPMWMMCPKGIFFFFFS